MRLSYSALGSFQTCPAQYKFQYIDKIKTPKSREAVFGTIIHDTLRMLHDPSNLAPPTEEEFLGYFSSKWKPEMYENSQEEAVVFHQGVRLLKDYYAKNYPANFSILDLESYFEIQIPLGSETHKLTGRIDRIDKIEGDFFEIIDYKTAKKLPPQKTIDDNLQLSIYYLGLIQRWPHLLEKNTPVKTSLYFVKHGEKLSTTRDKNHLAATMEKLTELIEQIKKSDFEPQPNPLCDWCGYQRQCPYFRHKFRNEEVLADDIDIKSIIREFYEIKERSQKDTKRAAELKSLINKYCDINNLERVFEEDISITRSPQIRISYDEQKIKEILKPLGLWSKVLSFDQKKMTKIIKDIPKETRESIEETKIEKKFTVISIKKEKALKKPSV